MSEPAADSPTAGVDSAVSAQLWDRDAGTLRDPSRRVLVALIKGPYVSAEKQPQNWRALMSDAEEISSRLADMFLELVIDDERGIAFIRNADTYSGDAPQVVRTAPLTLMDTAMVLHLRRELVSASGAGRVIVGREEIYEQLAAYRGQYSTDDAGFGRRIDAAWTKMEKYGILLRTATSATDGRFEISPVLRLIFGPEQIQAVRDEYASLREASADTGGAQTVDTPEAEYDDAGDDDAHSTAGPDETEERE